MIRRRDEQMSTETHGCPVMRSRAVFDPMSTPPHDELVEMLNRLRADAPVYYWEDHDMWVVTEYDAVMAILRDPETFIAEGKAVAPDNWYSPRVWGMLEPTSHRRGGAAKVMGASDGADHKRLREPFKKAFQPRSINGYEDMVRGVCRQLLEDLLARGEAEWMTEFAKPLPMSVILSVLGLPQSDARILGRWSDSLMDLMTRSMTPEEQEARAQDTVDCETYIRAAMAERRAEPGKFPGLMDDVLTSIAQGIHEPMSEDELTASWTMEMLIGGHETTASTLVSSLRHMMARRELWDALCVDPSLIPNAVEEFLRVEPPTFGFFRHTSVETVIAGMTIPAGAQVYWVNFAANHDESHFRDPDRIEFGRSNAASHLSFGRGVHTCIGAPLARLELTVAYQVLTEMIPSIRAAADQDELAYVPSIRMRVPTGFRVEWDM
jgi:cytochrome P450